MHYAALKGLRSHTFIKGLTQVSSPYATGIATSAIYTEYKRREVFPAMKVTDGRVLVIKSHASNIEIQNCSRAIILVRNPFRAIIAEFSRQKAGKTGVPQMENFKTEGKNLYLVPGPHTPSTNLTPFSLMVFQYTHFPWISE